MPTMTAAQHKARAKTAYDAYLADCPSHHLLDLISTKWVTLTLSALAEAPLRYSELARIIPSVSPKMLTQTLRRLEDAGLVRRTVTASVPVRVDYELSPLGESLMQLIRPLKAWAEEHMADVAAARAPGVEPTSDRPTL